MPSCPTDQPETYDLAMAQRLRVLARGRGEQPVIEAAIRSLNDDADRYAETVLLGLAVSESARVRNRHRPGSSRPLLPTGPDTRLPPPRATPLRPARPRSAHGRRWAGLVERGARARVAESSIGWLAGLSAAIAMIGEELVNGLSALAI